MTMQTIAVNDTRIVEIISAYAATNQQIAAVASSPGWMVVGGFYLPVTTEARLELVGSASQSGLTVRGRLFDVQAVAAVSGTVVTLTSLVDVRALSGAVELLGGRVYQMQVETVGAGGFGVVRSAMLVGS